MYLQRYSEIGKNINKEQRSAEQTARASQTSVWRTLTQIIKLK